MEVLNLYFPDGPEDSGNATRLRMQRIYDPLSHLINTSILCVTCHLSFGCLATANNGSLAAIMQHLASVFKVALEHSGFQYYVDMLVRRKKKELNSELLV